MSTITVNCVCINVYLSMFNIIFMHILLLCEYSSSLGIVLVCLIPVQANIIIVTLINPAEFNSCLMCLVPMHAVYDIELLI